MIGLAWPALLLAVLALLPGPFGFLASMVFLAWTAAAGITFLVLGARQPRPHLAEARRGSTAAACVISQSGSYQVVRGTGRYAGLSGHGTYQLSLEIVAARASGHCSAAKPPLAQQELLRLSGPVRR